MLAFNSDAAVKELYLARVMAHRAADELVHGVYWEQGKGCAVGCTIHSSDHSAYERELGIPLILARLEDGIFEGLSNGESKQWPEDFLRAIPTGADLAMVWPQFAIWLMVDEKHGVLQCAKTEKSRLAIQGVADGYRTVLAGGVFPLSAGEDAASAASAAYSCYATSDYAASASAAYAASAASLGEDAASAASAAYSASLGEDAAYAYTYRGKHRAAQAAKLLELLAAAPVPENQMAA